MKKIPGEVNSLLKEIADGFPVLLGDIELICSAVADATKICFREHTVP